MARAKKEQAGTAEERLKAALVPEAEWPYAVPMNWVWVRLGEIISLISGRDVSLSLCNDTMSGIPYILGASNLIDNTFQAERWIEDPEVVSVQGDVLLSVKGTIGKVYLQQEPQINISRQIMALRVSQAIDRKCLVFFLHMMSDLLKGKGNGLIPGISRNTILETKFPLPPSPNNNAS